MSRRWECPAGQHQAVLGPTRPRRDDTCRYCWPCSEAKGRLVERVCPVLEKKRAVKEERVAARTSAQRAARREEAATYPQVLHSVFRAWCRLSIWGTSMDDIQLVVRRRSPGRVLVLREEIEPGKFMCHNPGSPGAKGEPVYASATYSTGRAHGGSRIVITAGTVVPQGYATLCHELAHIADYRRHASQDSEAVRLWRINRSGPMPRRDAHGNKFRSILVAATQRITGVEPTFPGYTSQAIQLGIDKAFEQWMAAEHA